MKLKVGQVVSIYEDSITQKNLEGEATLIREERPVEGTGTVEVSQEPRLVYFIMETEKSPDGQYIPCIAKEGEKGFYRTDWTWGTDKEQAQKFADERNEGMGLSRWEAAKIQLGTMF